ncbi:hypothetical protein QYF36_008784 [Acer negundo]|nr:hypothetical protein QYF36_008784 [Acer negundo]
MTVAGKRPLQILKALKQRNPSLVTDSRNVYNVKAKIRREMSSGEQDTGKKMEPSSSSSTAINGVVTSGSAAGLTQADTLVQNGVAVTGSSRAYLENKAVHETKALAAELCRHFYTLGWVSGTGGRWQHLHQSPR